jgi:4-alpha-glucanotransferase
MRLYRHFGEVIAEDLGNLPDYLRPALDRLSIPGYKVLRWEQHEAGTPDPAAWPALSVATNSTHDTESTADWYDHLSVEQRTALLARAPSLAAANIDPRQPFNGTIRDALLRAISGAGSSLSLVSFQDALGSRERINTPGTVGASNWTYRMAMDLDALAADAETRDRLAAIATEGKRAPSDSD